jgi:RecA-family ATPase/biotin operon repressor
VEPVSKLLKREVQPVAYLFKGLLARGASSLLAGPPKGFKTTLAMWLALVAVGAVRSEWARFRRVGDTKFRVGYIDLEQSDGVFYMRLKEFEPNAAAVKRLFRLTPPKFKLDEQGLDELEQFIQRYQLDLLIIDTLARVRTHQRGMSASQIDADLLEPITKLAHETGCHILIITHTGKRKDYENPLDMIGSTSQLAAAVDDVLVLYKPENADSELRRHLFVAGRHITAAGTYVIERTRSGFTLMGEASEILQGEAQKQVLAALRSQLTAATPQQIAAMLGKSRSAVHKVLSKLVDQKLVITNGKGGYELLKTAFRSARL